MKKTFLILMGIVSGHVLAHVYVARESNQVEQMLNKVPKLSLRISSVQLSEGKFAKVQKITLTLKDASNRSGCLYSAEVEQDYAAINYDGLNPRSFLNFHNEGSSCSNIVENYTAFSVDMKHLKQVKEK